MTRSQARAHILVVEDDRDLRDSLIEVLEEAGYSVAGAKDGLHALAVLRAPGPRPDLILLDLQMPNMDGTEFRGEQLKQSDIASIPVAVVSADATGSAKARTLKAAAHLRKPLRIAQLLDLIPKVVGTCSPERAE